MSRLLFAAVALTFTSTALAADPQPESVIGTKAPATKLVRLFAEPGSQLARALQARGAQTL